MKVLFLTHGFPPTQHSGVFRTEAFAKYLPEYGVEPVVVAATDPSRAPPYPSPASFAEASSPCPVFRTDWGLQSPPQTSARWVRLLLRWPLGATAARQRWRSESAEPVLRLARQVIRDHHPAVIYASSPPEESALMATQLGVETGLPVVCDFRDIWSYGFEKRYRHLVDFRLERRLERKCLSKAWRVIANTPTAMDLLVTRIGVDREKVVCLPNGFDEEDFADVDAAQDLEPGKFTVLHTGVLTGRLPARRPLRAALKRLAGIDYNPMQVDHSARSPQWFLQAAERLLDRKPELRDLLRIRFVGNYSPADRQPFAAFRYPECLTFAPAVTRREAVALCCRASLLLLLQVDMRLDGREYGTAVPGKLFDYLRSGTRILAPLQCRDARDIVERFQAGVCVPPRDVEAIEAALSAEIDRWNRSGRVRAAAARDSIEIYDRRRLTRRLAEILQQAASKS